MFNTTFYKKIILAKKCLTKWSSCAKISLTKGGFSMYNYNSIEDEDEKKINWISCRCINYYICMVNITNCKKKQ